MAMLNNQRVHEKDDERLFSGLRYDDHGIVGWVFCLWPFDHSSDSITYEHEDQLGEANTLIY